MVQSQTRSPENPDTAYLQLSYASTPEAVAPPWLRGDRRDPSLELPPHRSGLPTLTGAGQMPWGGVRGAGATLAGSPLLRSIRQQAEWKGTLGVNSPRAPVAGMSGATRGPLCGTGPRPSAPGLALPHPGTALSPLLFPSIIRRSGGCARMCPVSTSGCKELNSYQLLERRKQELLFTEKSDASPLAAPSPLPASIA